MFVCTKQVNAGASMMVEGVRMDYPPYDDWADPKTFPGLFQGLLRSDRGMSYIVAVDDNGSRLPEPKGGFILSVTKTLGHIFWAKDRSTLAKGFGRMPPTARVSGPGNLGFFTGAYDLEVGGWGKTKINTVRAWTSTAYGKQMQAAGESFLSFAHRANRGRLLTRGYFVMIGSADAMSGLKRKVGLMQDDMPLQNLAALIKGRMTRDEAVDKLMEDLLM
jgi:hypothetical protein